MSTVLVAVNLQVDFLLPKGKLPVVNRAGVLPASRQIMNWARLSRTPIISTLECHRDGASGRGMPAHCVEKTVGLKMVPFGIMPHRVVMDGDNTHDLPLDVFRKYRQVIMAKRAGDFLDNEKACRLVNSLSRGTIFVVMGCGEESVKLAALGLLTRRFRVAVVTDAVGWHCAAQGELALRQAMAKGAMQVSVEDVCSNAIEAKFEAEVECAT